MLKQIKSLDLGKNLFESDTLIHLFGKLQGMSSLQALSLS